MKYTLLTKKDSNKFNYKLRVCPSAHSTRVPQAEGVLVIKKLRACPSADNTKVPLAERTGRVVQL